MAPHDVLRELCALSARLGVVVRIERFDPRILEGRGGLCWLRGVPTVLVDEALPLYDKIGVLVAALSVFDIEALYVPPALRQRLRAAG